MGERAGAGFLGKWFYGHPNEANSLSKKGAEPILVAPPTRDVDGVGLLGRKGAMERAVDGKRVEPSQLHMTCQGEGDDVRLHMPPLQLHQSPGLPLLS